MPGKTGIFVYEKFFKKYEKVTHENKRTYLQ
jgi:hypothetical protein